MDWANDWAPYVFGGYIYLDGYAYELNFTFGYERKCQTVLTDPAGDRYDLPRAFSAPLDGEYDDIPYYVLSLPL